MQKRHAGAAGQMRLTCFFCGRERGRVGGRNGHAERLLLLRACAGQPGDDQGRSSGEGRVGRALRAEGRFYVHQERWGKGCGGYFCSFFELFSGSGRSGVFPSGIRMDTPGVTIGGVSSLNGSSQNLPGVVPGVATPSAASVFGDLVLPRFAEGWPAGSIRTLPIVREYVSRFSCRTGGRGDVCSLVQAGSVASQPATARAAACVTVG